MDDQIFAMMFKAQDSSPLMRQIWQEAYGDDYPEDADPLSFVTKADLRRICEALHLDPGEDLVDLGCGAGGPAVHVARSLGARLTGIDASKVALEFARQRYIERLSPGSRFKLGDLASTGLPDAFAHGVMSTDALLFAPDPAAAFHEAARISRSGGVLAFTSYELRAPSTSLGGIGPIEDYRPYLEDAGFVVDVYEETSHWERRMRAVFSGILERRSELEDELGEQAAELSIAWATLRPQELPDSRRIFVAARLH